MVYRDMSGGLFTAGTVSIRKLHGERLIRPSPAKDGVKVWAATAGQRMRLEVSGTQGPRLRARAEPFAACIRVPTAAHHGPA